MPLKSLARGPVAPAADKNDGNDYFMVETRKISPEIEKALKIIKNSAGEKTAQAAMAAISKYSGKVAEELANALALIAAGTKNPEMVEKAAAALSDKNMVKAFSRYGETVSLEIISTVRNVLSCTKDAQTAWKAAGALLKYDAEAIGAIAEFIRSYDATPGNVTRLVEILQDDSFAAAISNNYRGKTDKIGTGKESAILHTLWLSIEFRPDVGPVAGEAKKIAEVLSDKTIVSAILEHDIETQVVSVALDLDSSGAVKKIFKAISKQMFLSSIATDLCPIAENTKDADAVLKAAEAIAKYSGVAAVAVGDQLSAVALEDYRSLYPIPKPGTSKRKMVKHAAEILSDARVVNVISKYNVRDAPYEEVLAASKGIAEQLANPNKIAQRSPFVFVPNKDILGLLANKKIVAAATKTLHYLPAALLNFEYSEAKAIVQNPEKFIQAAKFLNEQFGLEYFQRFSYKTLNNAYLTATDADFSKGKKVALVVLNKNDWNGAFEEDRKIFDSLVDKGYCLVLCEAGDENEVVERYFNRGKKEGKESALGKRKYDAVILGGHGTPWDIKFGKDFDETGSVDLGDYAQNARWMPGSWNTMLVDDAPIVLVSCSTGGTVNKEDPVRKYGDFHENFGNFQNIMKMIGILASNATVYAPSANSGLADLEFNRDGKIVDVEYSGAKTKNSKAGK